jgi:membrane protein YqaA with SNARE-associated domain
MGYLRRLYDWVLGWAETPYGIWALFVLAFSESSFFPIPPDVLLIALVIGAEKSLPGQYPSAPDSSEDSSFLRGIGAWARYFARVIPWILSHVVPLLTRFPRSRPAYFALVCSLGSVLGGVFGYCIGHFFWYTGDGTFSSIARFFFSAVPGFSEEAFYGIRESYDTWNFWIVFTAGFTPIPYKLITITAGVFKINFPIFCVASFVSRSARFFLVAGLLWVLGPPIRTFVDRYFNLICFLFLFLLVLGFVAAKLFV